MLNNEARKELGKFFIFAGVILPTTLNMEKFTPISLLLVRMASMVITVSLGVFLLNKLK